MAFVDITLRQCEIYNLRHRCLALTACANGRFSSQARSPRYYASTPLNWDDRYFRDRLEGELEESTEPELVELTAKIVSAYVSNNSVVASDLPHLISETHAALSRASGGPIVVEREEQKPKVPVKKSVMPDYLICLEDGKKFKSLKRHLRTHYNLSPEEYREKWGLPHDYPMVAPNYARARSDLAKKMGLGTRR
jgi:predicted transcriptional regulator